MVDKLERFFFGLIIAPLAPLVGFLLAWWLSYSLLPERWIPLVTISGLCLGILADILLLGKLLRRVHRLTPVFWAAAFLFYSVGLFGMFMGVPVFNALLAVPAGFIVAAKTVRQKADLRQVRQAGGRAAWFTTGILFTICAASAFIALASTSTASDLRGMLGLGFEVTQTMIIGLIVAGGLGLLVVNWLLTFGSSRLAYYFLQKVT
jgi:hypothetical protein